MTRSLWLFVLGILAIVGVDQVTQHFAFEELNTCRRGDSEVCKMVNFTHFTGYAVPRYVYALVSTVGVFLILLLFIILYRTSPAFSLLTGLFVGAIISRMIDIAYRGIVADFIDIGFASVDLVDIVTLLLVPVFVVTCCVRRKEIRKGLAAYWPRTRKRR